MLLLIDENGTINAENYCKYDYLGGYSMCHSCRDFIDQYTPYLPTIVVLQKLWLVTGHNIAEVDSLLTFKHVE
jgi:hypothetical protein